MSDEAIPTTLGERFLSLLRSFRERFYRSLDAESDHVAAMAESRAGP